MIHYLPRMHVTSLALVSFLLSLLFAILVFFFFLSLPPPRAVVHTMLSLPSSSQRING